MRQIIGKNAVSGWDSVIRRLNVSSHQNILVKYQFVFHCLLVNEDVLKYHNNDRPQLNKCLQLY